VFILVIIRSYYSVCVKHGVFKFSSKWYINLPLDFKIFGKKNCQCQGALKVFLQREELLEDEFRGDIKKEETEL